MRIVCFDLLSLTFASYDHHFAGAGKTLLKGPETLLYGINKINTRSVPTITIGAMINRRVRKDFKIGRHSKRGIDRS
jgi:hypothetical protein